MKNHTHSFIVPRLYRNTVITLVFLIIASAFLYSVTETQANDKIKTRMKLLYFKNSDDTKTLVSTIKFKKDRRPTPVNNIKVFFYAVTDSTDVLLGDAQTNNKGEAIINFIKDYEFPKDLSGNSTFKAKFNGDDTFKSAAKEITIRDLQMELFLDIIDFVKTISVNAYSTIIAGEKIPVDEADINFYVVGLFSLLKIEEGYIEGGKSSFIFPENSYGDFTGNVTIVAKIENSDLYGNVEQRKSIDWGKVTASIDFNHPKRLFGAPLWVTIILYTVLLVAILHSLYAIYNLFFIAKKLRIN